MNPKPSLVCLAGVILALAVFAGLGAEGKLETVGTFDLSPANTAYEVWGAGTQRRAFAEELLPACFERTLALDELVTEIPLQWTFTGPRAGVTLSVQTNEVRLSHRFYDSPGYFEVAGKISRHPEWNSKEQVFVVTGQVRTVALRLDGRLGLALLVNGQERHRQEWMHDLSRHQVVLAEREGIAKGRWLQPTPANVTVRVEPNNTHQRMLGFGGITTPTAYALLSEEGKQKWWNLVAKYNLLIQREYPNGLRLNPAMDNWDRLADATPHYYGDNFPNGEISNFAYNRRIRELGGQVWFEFWKFPRWVGTNVDKYAAAIVNYCRTAQQRAGSPPDIVGIQNEIRQSPAQWRAMTLALRQALDTAGFKSVKIHMADASNLKEGIEFLRGFQHSPEAWAKIDFTATHLYDFQDFFTKPDNFDERITTWKGLTEGKPFLSTELCVNNSKYQTDSYRLALTMGQLYHKNLALLDAVAVCYCWTLLNVVQPTYGATRSLCVPDEQNGLVPIGSSHQLRTFGAYSRRIQRGMTRLSVESGDPDLLVTAFAGDNGRATLVALNRGTRPVNLDVQWPGVRFIEAETVDPYQPNLPKPIGAAPRIPPGAIVTLTSVPLGKLAPGFLDANDKDR